MRTPLTKCPVITQETCKIAFQSRALKNKAVETNFMKLDPASLCFCCFIRKKKSLHLT